MWNPSSEPLIHAIETCSLYASYFPHEILTCKTSSNQEFSLIPQVEQFEEHTELVREICEEIGNRENRRQTLGEGCKRGNLVVFSPHLLVQFVERNRENQNLAHHWEYWVRMDEGQHEQSYPQHEKE